MSDRSETAKELVVRLGREQRLTYTITPLPDALLPADSLGGQLTALSDLFAALGRNDGQKLKTMVADISMAADGAITFQFVIARVEPEEDESLRPAANDKAE